MRAGTNACYAEEVSKIHKLPADYQPRTEEMCINTEWGAFNANCLPIMQEDRRGSARVNSRLRNMLCGSIMYY
jgi:hexokinase